MPNTDREQLIKVIEKVRWYGAKRILSGKKPVFLNSSNDLADAILAKFDIKEKK